MTARIIHELQVIHMTRRCYRRIYDRRMSVLRAFTLGFGNSQH